MQERIDSCEFSEWMAYYNVEPWGDDWAQAATIASMLTYGPLKRPIKPSDFIPGKKRTRRQTPEESMAVMKQFTAAHNAIVNKKAKRK